MTAQAQGSMIAVVPELHTVALVRLDMVNAFAWLEDAALFAELAQRVPSAESERVGSPSGVIQTVPSLAEVRPALLLWAVTVD